LGGAIGKPFAAQRETLIIVPNGGIILNHMIDSFAKEIDPN